MVKWLQTAWPLLRDVGITGTGLLAVWVQLGLWAGLGREPSPPLLWTSLGMLVPSAAAHVRHLLSAGSSSPSSPSLSPVPPPPSPLPEAGPGEH
jgi:hypothetical protein